MVLHREDRIFSVFHSFKGLIIQIDMRYLYIVWQ